MSTSPTILSLEDMSDRKLLMQIAFRPAHAEELQVAEELVVRSINDLTERHGFDSMAILRPPDFQLFSLKDDPDGLCVAEGDGEIVGFAFSWVTGDLWFLAELFISPDHQGRGIGSELLKRTFEHARKAGVQQKALITFTFNTISQGLYIRHGMFPRLPIYFFTASVDVLGPVDIHRSQIMAPTTNSMDANESAVFSYRVEMRRKCLILLKNRSIRLRSL